MLDTLDTLGLSFEASAFYTAGYDSPFRIL
jgi:hypothetical protein